MKEYPKKIKQEAISLHASGVSVAKIAESLSISRSTVYEWIKQSDQNADVRLTRSNLRLLENKVKRLEGIIGILQNAECTANAPLNEKRKEELREKIQEIYNKSNQIFGADKIAAVLKGQGNRVSDKMVRDLMRDMGLISIRQDAKSIYDKEQSEGCRI